MLHILSKDEIKTAEKIWRDLEEQSSEVGLTCKWDWVSTWIDCYKDLVPFWFIYAEKNQVPYGIVLITKETGRTLPFPVNTLHIGPAGEPYKDWIQMINNKILAKKEDKKRFIKQLIVFLKNAFSWEELKLDNFASSEAQIILEELSKLKINYSSSVETCYAVDLKKAREENTDIYPLLSYDTRHKIRRSIRAFENDIEVEWAEGEAEADEILQELITLHQKNWKKRGKRGLFSSKRFTKFHKRMLKKFLPTGEVIVARVKSRKYKTISCVHAYVDNGVVIGDFCGFNQFENVKFGEVSRCRIKPGFITHALLMQECLKRSFNEYNFSIGEAIYKKELSSMQTEVFSISVRNNIKPLIREKVMQTYFKLDSNKNFKTVLKPIYEVYKFIA